MKNKQNIINEIKDGLTYGLIVGLIFGLIFGLIYGLIFGLTYELIAGLIYGLIVGLIFGLIYGLIAGLIYGLIGGIVGLTITFITQFIALLTSNPEFVMLDFVVSGILIIIIQLVSWGVVCKLREQGK